MNRLLVLLSLLLSLSASAEFFNAYWLEKYFGVKEDQGQHVAKIYRYQDRYRGINITWKNAKDGAVVFEFAPSFDVQPFKEARVQLVYMPTEDTCNTSSIQLRFRDDKNENFAYSKPLSRIGKPGEMSTLDYIIRPQDTPDAVWGGDGNKKIDGVLHLVGLGIGVKDREAPGRIIILGMGFDVDYLTPPDQLKQLAIDFAERNPVMRLPGETRPIELHIRNKSKAPADVQAKVSLRNAEGETLPGVGTHLVLPPAESGRIDLPVPAKKGLYYADIQLTNAAGEMTLVTKTFAVMEPYGVHREFDTGFQLSISMQLGDLEPPNRDYALYLASLIGCNSFRDSTNWFDAEQHNGEMNYSRADSVIQCAAQYGMIPELIASFTPSWAVKPTWSPFAPLSHPNLNNGFLGKSGGGMGLPLPEDKYYERHIREFARRFHNVPIFYEIWNEPELPYFANFSPEEYVNLIRIAREEVDKYAPTSKIMNGGFSSSGPSRYHSIPDYVERVLELGHQYLDVVAIHGHGPFEGFADCVESLKAIMKRHNITKPWWANESAEHSVHIGEYRQAQILVKKAVYTMGEGGVGYTWYCFRNLNIKNDDPTEGENRFGMLNYDYSPRPNFIAFNTVARQLRKATFIKKAMTTFKGLYAYQFKAPRGNQLVLWHANEGQGLFWMKAKAPVIIDIFGNESPIPLTNDVTWLQTSSVPFFVQDTQSVPELLAPVVELRAKSIKISKQGDIQTELIVNNPTPDVVMLDVDLVGNNCELTGKTHMTLAVPSPGNTRVTIPVRLHSPDGRKPPTITIKLNSPDTNLSGTITRRIDKWE